MNNTTFNHRYKFIAQLTDETAKEKEEDEAFDVFLAVLLTGFVGRLGLLLECLVGVFAVPLALLELPAFASNLIQARVAALRSLHRCTKLTHRKRCRCDGEGACSAREHLLLGLGFSDWGRDQTQDHCHD